MVYPFTDLDVPQEETICAFPLFRGTLFGRDALRVYVPGDVVREVCDF